MSMRQIIAEQYVKLPILVDNKTCSGKTYIVTGSNNGIGLETARHLVASSATRVIIAVRNTAAGEKAKADIEKTTGRKGVLDVWQLDLASYASTKKFAEKVRNELDRIDGLIQNAGVFLKKWTVAEDMETTMTVNVVNTMFLAMLIMPKLIASARKFSMQPRLVFLVSGLGFQAPAKKELDKGSRTHVLQSVNNSKEQIMDERYSLSKLIEIHAVRAMSEMFPLDKTNVVINMVSPGICSTGLARDASLFIRTTQGIIRTILARTAEQGSRTTLHALVTEEATHGKHLSGCKVKDCWVPSWMTNADGQQMEKQIWKELLALMEKEWPGSASIQV